MASEADEPPAGELDNWPSCHPTVGRDRALASIDATLTGRSRGVVIFGAVGSGRSRLIGETVARASASGIQVIDLDGWSDGGWADQELDPAAVIVVDDAHEIDPALAESVARAVAAGARLVATVCFGVDVVPALTALWRDGGCERVDLDPLDAEQIEQLSAHLLGARCDPLARRRFADLSAGSPRLLVELLRCLHENGGLVRFDGVASLNGALVPSARLRDVVMADLGPAESPERELYESLSLVRAIDLPVAIALVGTEAVERAEQTGKVRVIRDGRRTCVELVSALDRQILQAALGEIRTGRLAEALLRHRQAGRRAHDDAETGVLEVLAGRCDDIPAIVEAARRARAEWEGALAERLARTAAATGDPEAVIELAECLYWQERYEEELEVLEQHDFSGLPDEWRARRAKQLAGMWFWGFGRAGEAGEAMASTLEDLTEPEARLEVLGHRSEIRMFGADFAGAIEDAEEVLDAPAASVVARLSAFTGLIVSLALCGRVDEAIARAPEGIALMLLYPDTEMAGAGAFVGMCLAQLLSARFADLDGVVTALLAQSLARPEDPLRGIWAHFVGRSALAQGDLDTARLHLTEAVALLRQHDPGRALSWALSSLAQVQAMQGDAQAARETLLRAQAAQFGAIRCYDLELVLAQAWVAVAENQPEHARAILRRGADDARSSGAWSVFAGASFDASRIGQAGRLVEWAEAAKSLEGPLFPLMAQAATAGPEPAELERIARGLEALGAKLWAAELYATASRHFARCHDDAGLARSRARSVALALECGRPRTPALADLDHLGRTAKLTARQAEIARLAARGLSNRAIADELLLSVRTVENHLAQAYRGLGVSRREDLGVFF